MKVELDQSDVTLAWACMRGTALIKPLPPRMRQAMDRMEALLPPPYVDYVKQLESASGNPQPPDANE